jgi:hypothetical protein
VSATGVGGVIVGPVSGSVRALLRASQRYESVVRETPVTSGATHPVAPVAPLILYGIVFFFRYLYMGVDTGLLLKLGGGLLVLFIIYLLVAGAITLVLYTRIGQGTKGGFWYTDRDKLKKYIFKSWIDWAGRPSTFSYLNKATPFYSTPFKTLTGTNVLRDCMLQCESVNDRGKTAKCVGFEYTQGATSNTCVLMSTMDGLSVGDSGNTVYFVDGLDTAREYQAYISKTQAGVTLFDGNPYVSTKNGNDCFSNCASMSDCQGLILKDTGSGAQKTTTCALVKDKLDPTKFTADTSSTILYLRTHDALSSSSLQYWTS